MPMDADSLKAEGYVRAAGKGGIPSLRIEITIA